MASSSPVRKIVVAGSLSAVAVVLFVTNLGFIPWIAGASLTVMHVPAIIGAILEGPLVGALIGGIFGVTSLIKSAVAPQGPIDLFFVNPLVSVLPRLLIGVAAWAVFSLFRGKFTPVASVFAGVVGSVTNSVLVLGLLVLLGAIPLAVGGAVFVGNSIIEAVIAGVLTMTVVAAWTGIEGKGGASRLSSEGK